MTSPCNSPDPNDNDGFEAILDDIIREGFVAPTSTASQEESLSDVMNYEAMALDETVVEEQNDSIAEPAQSMEDITESASALTSPPSMPATGMGESRPPGESQNMAVMPNPVSFETEADDARKPPPKAENPQTGAGWNAAGQLPQGNASRAIQAPTEQYPGQDLVANFINGLQGDGKLAADFANLVAAANMAQGSPGTSENNAARFPPYGHNTAAQASTELITAGTTVTMVQGSSGTGIHGHGAIKPPPNGHGSGRASTQLEAMSSAATATAMAQGSSGTAAHCHGEMRSPPSCLNAARTESDGMGAAAAVVAQSSSGRHGHGPIADNESERGVASNGFPCIVETDAILNSYGTATEGTQVWRYEVKTDKQHGVIAKKDVEKAAAKIRKKYSDLIQQKIEQDHRSMCKDSNLVEPSLMVEERKGIDWRYQGAKRYFWERTGKFYRKASDAAIAHAWKGKPYRKYKSLGEEIAVMEKKLEEKRTENDEDEMFQPRADFVQSQLNSFKTSPESWDVPSTVAMLEKALEMLSIQPKKAKSKKHGRNPEGAHGGTKDKDAKDDDPKDEDDGTPDEGHKDKEDGNKKHKVNNNENQEREREGDYDGFQEKLLSGANDELDWGDSESGSLSATDWDKSDYDNSDDSDDEDDGSGNFETPCGGGGTVGDPQASLHQDSSDWDFSDFESQSSTDWDESDRDSGKSYPDQDACAILLMDSSLPGPLYETSVHTAESSAAHSRMETVLMDSSLPGPLYETSVHTAESSAAHSRMETVILDTEKTAIEAPTYRPIEQKKSSRSDDCGEAHSNNDTYGAFDSSPPSSLVVSSVNNELDLESHRVDEVHSCKGQEEIPLSSYVREAGGGDIESKLREVSATEQNASKECPHAIQRRIFDEAIKLNLLFKDLGVTLLVMATKPKWKGGDSPNPFNEETPIFAQRNAGPLSPCGNLWYAFISTFFGSTGADISKKEEVKVLHHVKLSSLISKESWSSLVTGFMILLRIEDKATETQLTNSLDDFFGQGDEEGNEAMVHIVHCPIGVLDDNMRRWLYMVDKLGNYIPVPCSSEKFEDAEIYLCESGILCIRKLDGIDFLFVRSLVTKTGLKYPRDRWIDVSYQAKMAEGRSMNRPGEIGTPQQQRFSTAVDRMSRKTTPRHYRRRQGSWGGSHGSDPLETGLSREDDDENVPKRTESVAQTVLELVAQRNTQGSSRDNLSRTTPQKSGAFDFIPTDRKDSDWLGRVENNERHFAEADETYHRVFSLLLGENDKVYESGLAFPGRSCWDPAAEPDHAFLSDSSGRKWYAVEICMRTGIPYVRDPHCSSITRIRSCYPGSEEMLFSSPRLQAGEVHYDSAEGLVAYFSNGVCINGHQVLVAVSNGLRETVQRRRLVVYDAWTLPNYEFKKVHLVRERASRDQFVSGLSGILVSTIALIFAIFNTPAEGNEHHSILIAARNMMFLRSCVSCICSIWLTVLTRDGRFEGLHPRKDYFTPGAARLTAVGPLRVSSGWQSRIPANLRTLLNAVGVVRLIASGGISDIARRTIAAVLITFVLVSSFGSKRSAGWEALLGEGVLGALMDLDRLVAWLRISAKIELLSSFVMYGIQFGYEGLRPDISWWIWMFMSMIEAAFEINTIVECYTNLAAAVKQERWVTLVMSKVGGYNEAYRAIAIDPLRWGIGGIANSPQLRGLLRAAMKGRNEEFWRLQAVGLQWGYTSISEWCRVVMPGMQVSAVLTGSGIFYTAHASKELEIKNGHNGETDMIVLARPQILPSVPNPPDDWFFPDEERLRWIEPSDNPGLPFQGSRLAVHLKDGGCIPISKPQRL